MGDQNGQHIISAHFTVLACSGISETVKHFMLLQVKGQKVLCLLPGAVSAPRQGVSLCPDEPFPAAH